MRESLWEHEEWDGELVRAWADEGRWRESVGRWREREEERERAPGREGENVTSGTGKSVGERGKSREEKMEGEGLRT